MNIERLNRIIGTAGIKKDTSVGSSRYISKYPLSGLLVCGS